MSNGQRRPGERTRRDLGGLFERALVAGSALAFAGCCEVMSLGWAKHVPAHGWISAVAASAPPPAAPAANRASGPLDAAYCKTTCGTYVEACMLAELSVPRPVLKPLVRCDYETGPSELRGLPEGGLIGDSSGHLAGVECAYACADPERATKSCALAAGETSPDQVILCRSFKSGGCVTHIPSGRAPRGLDRRSLTAPRNESDYLAAAHHLEAASVGAFLDLGAQLERLGAPRALGARARQAANDERRHARVMGRLARAAGATLRQAEPTEARPLKHAALAIENAREGCVAETYSALVNAHQARHAPTSILRRVFAAIAREELAHAALAWDVHRWLWARLTADEQREVLGHAHAARERLAHARPDLPAADERALGLPDRARADRLLAALTSDLWSDEAGWLTARRDRRDNLPRCRAGDRSPGARPASPA